MTYQGSVQQYSVIRKTDVMIQMRDGVQLATDLYMPAAGGEAAAGEFPTVLVRTPYNKVAESAVRDAKFLARRGYVCALQDVRGRFASEGEWYAFAKEAPDGYDTVEWLGSQSWSDGKVGTMGDSYAGSDQAALATMDPPHLSTMIVAVGASNYYHSSMRQNRAEEQRFRFYAFRMATTSKEAEADPGLKAALMEAFEQRMGEYIEHYPLREGATVLSRIPSYEKWAIDIQTHGEYDDYWKQRGYAISEYYEEHADVPTLYLGGWYDSYARNTCESYIALSKTKKSPQHLLMGPWTHGKYEVPFAGELFFGTQSPINYLDLKLAWFDEHLKGLDTEVAEWSPVRIFTMGASDGKPGIPGSPKVGGDYLGHLNHGGYWRSEPDWPLPETNLTPYYLHGDGSLSPQNPGSGTDETTEFTYDPSNPVPTIGGGISAADDFLPAGGFDQRGRPDLFGAQDTLPLNIRGDVLTFQTPPLDRDVEVTGPVTMHLWASSSAVDTDFTAKLIDVYPAGDNHTEGLAMNITDSIIRARYRNGWDSSEMMTPGEAYELVFELFPTSNVFRKGHRIRLDISSSNWPRFDVNTNTGGPLGRDRTYIKAHQTIHHGQARASHIVLPLQGTGDDR
ncbi:MAG: CocE/NonD family hydrolase [SAR202 cluster bacterium]|nr:CocE/NonD family hydrolase [SAR202 cluster bacterium]